MYSAYEPGNAEAYRRLVKSATLGTVIGSGEINQIAPYARRQGTMSIGRKSCGLNG